jgi:putative MATE family efflux protein
LKTIKTSLRLIRESLSGNTIDFTQISLNKAIILLSVPMILEMVMESVFAITDIFFVSSLGSNAISGVGLTESFLVIVYSFGGGLSVAATAIVSRRIGEKNPESAALAAVQSIIVGFLVSAVISVFGIIFSADLLKIMGASHEVIKISRHFTAIMLGGNFVIILLFVINGIFRSSGDAAISMRVLWIANILNIILDPCLIYGLGPFPKLGLTGAAIATTTGRGIGVLYQLYLLFSGSRRIKITLKQFYIDLTVMRQIIRLSFGTVMQHIADTVGWIGMVRIVSFFGSAALAGYTIAVRIVIFALLPSWGFSNSAATLVGQNLGAKQPDRAERSVWITFFFNIAFMACVALILIFFNSMLIRTFTSENQVVELGSKSLQYFGFAFLSIGAGMIFIQALNGAGDTSTPLFINIFAYVVLEIPLAYGLAIGLHIGINGVYYALISSQTFVSLISFYFFKRGKWKLRIV